uniref:Uncharacterized protein n=1 Tax=mine drainage metagenome TaxID=410659 RepID=E6QJP0_9ZZZZ
MPARNPYIAEPRHENEKAMVNQYDRASKA